MSKKHQTDKGQRTGEPRHWRDAEEADIGWVDERESGLEEVQMPAKGVSDRGQHSDPASPCTEQIRYLLGIPHEPCPDRVATSEMR